MGLEAELWALRLGFGPRGWDLRLKDGVRASRMGFGPKGWDLGLETRIWVSKLGFEDRRRRRRKFPICVKA